MDFYRIKERTVKKGIVEIYPDFRVCRSKDLMVRGKSFYAIWDEQTGLWSTDEYDVARLVDEELMAYKDQIVGRADEIIQVKTMSDFSSNSWKEYRKFLFHLADSSHQLDEVLTFSNTEVKKKDYVSRRLPYPLEAGSHDAFDELIDTLYDETESAKLKWAIGSIVAGDAKDIQKFTVLYGPAGSGKSTLLKVVQKLFVGYYTTFEAKALTSSSNSFSTEVFRSNPLVAIQHDGDLSRIEDNTKLNSIISHEEMTMNEKYKPSYMARVNCFLFMGTNKPVKITDAKSGIIRRLIDIQPSGNKIPPKRYHALMSQIDFELGAIASYCLDVYRSMGKEYYVNYKPVEMMYQTDIFYNFIEDGYDVFSSQNGVSLKQAYEMYKIYADEAMIEFKLPRHKFRDELRNYFAEFSEVSRIDNKQVRSYYSGFLKEKLGSRSEPVIEHAYPLVLDSMESLLDSSLISMPAQYANDREIPSHRWADVTTTLGDIDSTKLHYVKVPENHIVIDFDLKDENGNKSIEKNLEEASKWPPTYSEFSKSGAGIHLHYIYTGEVSKLSRIFDEGIEIKVFTGDASLRRRLSRCNRIPVASLNSGLPLKPEKMLNFDVVQSEAGIRSLILRNLNKEIHPGTKPSIDFILKILDDAYSSGIHYDVTDLRPKIVWFANNSTNRSLECLKTVGRMKFASEDPSPTEVYTPKELVFFDVEVFPNLFVVCWKYEGPDKTVVRMINPTPSEIEEILKLSLVGFNNRGYDNHILYARFIGYNNEDLFKLSQRIIANSPNSKFGEAYNLSYADIYDYTSKKQSLKKYQIELGLHHLELGLPWDEPVPEDMWLTVADYCANDVITTEQVHHSRKEDYIARQILAELSGLTVNDTTQRHTAKIIFGNDRNPQEKFVYTDLSEQFEGYTHEWGKSSYRGEVPGEGGYVYSEPGIYENVALLDVVSMHPTSLIKMNCFGPYTENFKQLLDARVAIKHKDYDSAKKMLGGILEKYLDDEQESFALAYALKIIINIVYGLTSASFSNKFKDARNVDNIVAKRGALFMIDLKHAVQEQGFVVAHIKTDSIKIPNATPEIIQFVMEFGAKYGYEFEHEETFDKFCLVNDAVYIAKYLGGKHAGDWTATGAQFAHPYVFKTLFSKESIEFDDLCETKSVTTALYLDMNEDLGPDEHDYHFIGRAGRFCPIKPGCGGGILLREKEGKYYAAGGTKGYRWLESEIVQSRGKSDDIDLLYQRSLVDDAIETISKFGDFETFVAD